MVRLRPKHWWFYLAAAQGLRRYDVLGSWRQSKRPCMQVSQRRPTSFAPEGREDGKDCRKDAFHHANARREAAARSRRQELVSAAAPVYEELMASLGRKPGSPALRQALRAAGSEVADRDARWLAKQLTANYAAN